MSPAISRYVVPVDYSRVEYLKTALALAAELHKKLGCIGEIILFVPHKGMVERTTLADAIGTSVIKGLKKNRTVPLKRTCNMKLESMGTIKRNRNAEIIVGIYAHQKMLDEIDGLFNVKGVIVAPSKMDDLTQWIRTWNPEIVGQEPTPPEKLIENPVIEKALKAITGHINLSTGLTYPSDHDYAVGLLKCVHKHFGLEPPNSIRAWAIRNRWSPDAANKLAGIARSLLEHRRVHGGKNFRCTKQIIEWLRDRSENKT